MIKSNSSAAFPGKIGNEFRKLWEAVQALQPIPSPGVRVQQTTRGVALQIKQPATINANVVELTFVAEYDDFLACTNAAGETVYVAKPPTLRSSQWNPGWQPGTGDPGIEIFATPYGDGFYPYGRALRYVNAHARFRIKFSRSSGQTVERMKCNDANESTLSISYEVIREMIYPAYFVPLTNGVGITTVDLGKIYAIKLSEPLFQTTEELDVFGDVVVAAGQDITYLDLNTDGRTWQPLGVSHPGHLFEITGAATPAQGRRAVQFNDNQGNDQNGSNPSPAIMNTSTNAFGLFHP